MTDILFGKRQWPSTIDPLLPPDDLRLVQIYGADTNDMFAYGLTVGDADGDGKPDIISNAMAGDGFDNQVRDAGEIYVLANDVLFEPATGPPPPLFLNVDIQPVFAATCLPCHSGDAPAGGLRFDIIQNSIADLLGPTAGGQTSTEVGCALANCHVGDGAASLNLEAVRAYDELVGVASTEVADPLVAPGDLAHSYLYEKVTTDRPRVGDRMPLATALDALDIEALRQWIAGGAPK